MRRAFRSLCLDRDQLGIQRIDKPRYDFVLHIEEVGDRLVEALGPQMISGLGGDHLHVHSKAVAATLHRPFKHIADVQLASQLLYVNGFALEGERRVARNHERAADALLPADVPILAIGPAANWRGKQWRAERFAELALRLTAPNGPLPGAHVAVMAAAHEHRQAEPLLASIPPPRLIDLVGKVDLLTATAVLRRCSLFIGNDTGLMHMAAAAGTPTLGLFGPSPSAKYAPWGECAAWVGSADPPDAMFGPGFDHRTTDTLMDGLSIDSAEAAACRLWRSVESLAA